MNPFDNWRSITVSLYMTLIGYGVLVGVPVISTAWVNLLGFTEEQVGRVVSANLGGLTAGGIYTAIAVATLGGSSRPARSYGLMMLAFAFSQAAEMHILPQLSVNGIYLLFMGCFLFTVPWIRWIPAHPPEEIPRSEKEQLKKHMAEQHSRHGIGRTAVLPVDVSFPA